MNWLFIILLLAPSLTCAQLFEGSPSDSKEPIIINSDSLDVDQNKNIATFKGKVEAVQGKYRLNSNEMLVYYHNKKEKAQSKVSKIETYGNVFFATPIESAQGDFGIYDMDKKLLTLTGKVILTKGKNVVQGNKLVYNLNTKQSTLTSDPKTSESKKRVQAVFVPDEKDKDSK